MKAKKCRFCGDLVLDGSDAFCQHNPNREKSLERWRNGDKRFKYKAKIWKIGPCLLIPKSPFIN